MNGTNLYGPFSDTAVVPPLALEAVEVAKRLDFPLCVHPATGRLLAAIAGGVVDGLIGETGTGTGVGVAWMLSTASPETQIVSIELDERRAQAAADLFVRYPQVTILQGDSNDIAEHGPFDLLVLDAPAADGPIAWKSLDPLVQLKPNGVLVKDDIWPMNSWPPRAFDGSVDVSRTHWLEHPALFATEIPVAEGYGVLVGRRRP